MGVRLRQEGWRQDRRRFTVSQTITGDPPFADTGLLNEHNPGLLVRPRPFADIPSDKRFPDERGKGDPRATTAIAVSRNQPHRRSPIAPPPLAQAGRSEEHTSELQSLMRSSYAVFCWKKHIPHTD